MNLKALQMAMLCQEVVAEFNVRVDSHSAPPNIDLVPISECHAMVIAEADVLDKLWSSVRV